MLRESYRNLIGASSIDDRKPWLDQAWNIIQSSYASIGGIKGSGFQSKEDLLTQIPFWKLYTRGDHLLAANFYKDKNGRKVVASASDGTLDGKRAIQDMLKSSLNIAYGERSGGSLGLMMKTIPWHILRHFLLTRQELEQLTGEKTYEVTPELKTRLTSGDQRLWNRFTQLHDYFYIRELGGELHMKVAIGTPHKTIT